MRTVWVAAFVYGVVGILRCAVYLDHGKLLRLGQRETDRRRRIIRETLRRKAPC